MLNAFNKSPRLQSLMPIDSIWGIYHGDGGLIGEIKYVAGALFRRQHCSLCDITHKIAWEKSDMKQLRKNFDVPFHVVHLNERPEDLSLYSEGITPILVAKTDSGFITIASDKELKYCSASVQSHSDLRSEKLDHIAESS